MDLWQFYEEVERLILALRERGHAEDAASVETAIRGGATSGEILGRLSLALPEVGRAGIPELSEAAGELGRWAHQALRHPTR